MKPAGLCMNCMNGYTANGVCTSCGATGISETARNVNALPLGCILSNRYYVGKVIGSGGFGITYMAWDMAAKRRVAIKELYPKDDVHRDTDGCGVRVKKGKEHYFEHVKLRFLDEAHLLSEFKNEKEIINIYHLFPANNTAYYAMEYMEGKDLRDYIKFNSTMSWTRMRPIAVSILRQLAILHRKGLIHRDISPDNIFLLKNGTVRLIDFGSVRTYVAKDHFTSFLKHNFAPVELYRENGDQKPWTDIYSLSVTMYYMMSGVLPGKAPQRIGNDPTVPLNKLVPDVPEYVSAAIMKGMAVMPEDRFKNAEEYLRALGVSPPPLSPVPTSIHSTSARSKHIIVCVKGLYKGKGWQVESGTAVTIGRNKSRKIKYPDNAGGVSRNHCTFALDKKGKLCVRDDGSSYGTFLNNVRLKPGEWKYVEEGGTVSFAQEVYKAIREK